MAVPSSPQMTGVVPDARSNPPATAAVPAFLKLVSLMTFPFLR
jgi:hypothetical protein